jgi:hypothetical protein
MIMNERREGGLNRGNVDDNHADDHHHEEEIQARIWTLAVFGASVLLLYLGYSKAALCFVAIGITYIFIGQESHTTKPLSAIDQYASKYNMFSVDDIVRDLQQLQIRSDERCLPLEIDGTTPDRSHSDSVLLALSTLTKRYGIAFQNQKKPTAVETELTSIACCCQEAVHICLQSSDNICNDAIVSSSLALLALVSKNEAVRQRYLATDKHPPDIDIRCKMQDVVQAINLALVRGQEYSDEPKEQIMAELQRKACLLLGALADGNELMAQHIGQLGGIQSVLDAISWYRRHNDVTCWGLWALFILCYENYMNKIILVQLHGIPILLEAMKQCPDSVEVSRHGTAILFDLLREAHTSFSGENTAPINNSTLDTWKIRKVALSAGLHERILHVVTHFSGGTNMDVYLMGREILLGTNYQGIIPEPQMTLVPST